MSAYVYEEITVSDLFQRFVKDLDYNQVSNTDISDLNIEIQSFDFESGENTWERINNLLVKDPVDTHYMAGDLKATGGHLVYYNDSFIRMDEHPDAVKINEPIKVVDFSINRVKNYFANGHLNHNTTPGGKALKHACSIMVEVGPMSGADNLILDEREEKQGHKIRAKITKNKVSAPFKVAEFFVDFRSGVTNVAEELLDLGVKVALIERPNNRSYVILGEKQSSRDLAIEFVSKNKEEVERTIREAYLSGADAAPSGKPEIEIENTDDPFGEE